MKIKLKKILKFALFIFLVSCSPDEGEIVQEKLESKHIDDYAYVNVVDRKGVIKPYDKLSEYKFFSGDLKDFTPKKNVFYYEPSSTLFTDLAEKSRFMYIPRFKKAVLKGDHEALNFPVNSILIKNFYFRDDISISNSPKRIIETRLMIMSENSTKDVTDNTWEFFTYVWNQDQTEAFLENNGRQNVTPPIHTTYQNYDGTGNSPFQITTYDIPTKENCTQCHSTKAGIGVRPSLLNWSLDGSAKTQLQRLYENNMLNTSPSSVIANIPNYKNKKIAIQERMSAYFDINCAHCHKPNSTANSSASSTGFYLDYINEGKTLQGYLEPTLYGGIGKFRIDPLSLLNSDVYQRMIVAEVYGGKAHIQMAKFGRSLPDNYGITLFSDYIKYLGSQQTND